MRRVLAAVLAMVGACALASSAQASDMITWTNYQAPYGMWMISDQGGSNLPYSNYQWKTGAMGLAFDPSQGRAYWSNPTLNTIGWSDVEDDSGTGDLATPGMTLNHPSGVAIDAQGGRLYVANSGSNKISFVRLDGTGGGDLNTGTAQVNSPYGIAVDPAVGRVYWSNNGGDKISYAKLDGTGGGDVYTGTVPVKAPLGVAVDPTSGRIYWSSYGTGDIGWAALNGSQAGVVNRTGATPGGTSGLAVDADTGRLVYGNISANKLSSAQLDGSGGTDIPTAGDTLKTPFAVALLQVPRNTTPPSITGAGAIGAQMTCDPGVWAPDVTASFLFRAPHTLTTTWARNGSLVRTAASAIKFTPQQAGQYTCQVRAKNAAGRTDPVVSAPVTVGSPTDANPPGAVNVSVTKFVTGNGPSGRIMLWTSVPGRVTITGGDNVATINRTLPAGDNTVIFKLTTAGKKVRAINHRLSLIFTIKLQPTDGGPSAMTQRSVLLQP
jgi:hypothetical protein